MSVRFGLPAAAFAWCLFVATAWAQQNVQQPLRTGASQAASRAGQAGDARQSQARGQRTANKPVNEDQNVDDMIAGMLALANQEEAAIGKFAAEHAKYGQVRQFAEMMVKDHSQLASTLLKWAPKATLGSGEGGEDGKDRETADEGAPKRFNPLEVHREIADRCLASTKKDLGTKKGVDFDMAYIGGQCVLHQQMIDKATVLRSYVSPELRAAIDKGISSAEVHLTHAKKLMDELVGVQRGSTR